MDHHSPLALKIAQLIRQSRIQKMWTLDELSSKSGIDLQTLTQIESADLDRNRIIQAIECMQLLDIDLGSSLLPDSNQINDPVEIARIESRLEQILKDLNSENT